eukprot:scaffold291836_cov42-Prasinocladus_malaysianus.AAC.2
MPETEKGSGKGIRSFPAGTVPYWTSCNFVPASMCSAVWTIASGASWALAVKRRYFLYCQDSYEYEYLFRGALVRASIQIMLDLPACFAANTTEITGNSRR